MGLPAFFATYSKYIVGARHDIFPDTGYNIIYSSSKYRYKLVFKNAFLYTTTTYTCYYIIIIITRVNVI